MNTEDEYQATLEYLYSFVDYSLSRSFRNSPDKFDLGRMRDLMAALGNPEQKYPSIHIAGTKGKGSVAVFCSFALRADGYRVGLYTSPHLHDYTERIQINGQPISYKELVSLVEQLKPVIESIPQITTFEITTALSLAYFANQKVDVAILEVGLGGRLDATNVVVPAVSVITSLSYDHTYVLGETLPEIAGEKAGIIKPGIPVVLSPQKEEARQVIESIAAERSSPLVQVGLDYKFIPLNHSLEGQSLLIGPAKTFPRIIEGGITNGGGDSEPVKLFIPLLGRHQVENAATAYTVLKVFSESAFPVGGTAICAGFSQTSWPGRFDVLNKDPILVVDSAHNRDSISKLRLTIEDYFPEKEIVLVFGASEDKDVYGMISELLPLVREVIATQSYHPRAMEVEYLVEITNKLNKPVRSVPDVADALEVAINLTDNNALALATGSLFIAAGAREAWMARQNIILETK
ncbi:MAG: bifunctional folylpolyglutamate synthase/dihydrofolate synthase [Anaerolineales bacterium]|nr:bifunctional folylpolyglutamate synthase/dihydrofolate synthase [Anaerolineales bacterium]